MRVTFVADDQVEPESNILLENADMPEVLATLRAYHALNAWHDELDIPEYAEAHYAGLHAIAALERHGRPLYTLVPVQYGVLVVT